jgi:hypothetical protein
MTRNIKVQGVRRSQEDTDYEQIAVVLYLRAKALMRARREAEAKAKKRREEGRR